MQSGPKRFEIAIERRVDTQVASGLDHTYLTVGHDFASIRALSGRELFAAQQVQSEVNTEIVIHWRADIDETCRIIHTVDPDSPEIVDTYDVAALLPDQKTGRRELVLHCVKRRAEGWRRGSDVQIEVSGGILTESGEQIMTESGESLVIE